MVQTKRFALPVGKPLPRHWGACPFDPSARFLVVADHSENLGLADLIAESNPQLLPNPWGKKVHDLVKAGKPFEAYGRWGLEMAKGIDPLQDDAVLVQPDRAYTSPVWYTPGG